MVDVPLVLRASVDMNYVAKVRRPSAFLFQYVPINKDISINELRFPRMYVYFDLPHE